MQTYKEVQNFKVGTCMKNIIFTRKTVFVNFFLPAVTLAKKKTLQYQQFAIVSKFLKRIRPK
jgi:hypothetical protein